MAVDGIRGANGTSTVASVVNIVMNATSGSTATPSGSQVGSLGDAGKIMLGAFIMAAAVFAAVGLYYRCQRPMRGGAVTDGLQTRILSPRYGT